MNERFWVGMLAIGLVMVVVAATGGCASLPVPTPRPNIEGSR